VRRSRAHQVGNLGMRLHPRRESRDEGRLPPLHEPSRGLVSLIEVSRDAVAEHQVGAVPRFFDLVDCFACHVAAWPDTGTEYFLDNRTTAPGAGTEGDVIYPTVSANDGSSFGPHRRSDA
jgi:hypothetical protein